MSHGSERRGLGLAMLLVLPCLLGVERPPGLGDIREVRTWSYPDYTRVVVEFSRPVEAEVNRLGANTRAGRPERLYADLPGIWVGRRFVDGIPVGDGLLSGVRLGQNTLSTSRLVIDLETYDRHRLITLESPHRLVIDVYGARDAPETLRWPTRAGTNGKARLSSSLRSVERVVIDPGHGGRDPGAIGSGGLREKDVNLRLAKMLRKRLEERGFEVVMTRDRDRTLSLEERTALAESARGDLFVSVHANASRRRQARGIEIYYLDENHERHALDVAARENEVSRSEMDSLQKTLARLRVAETGDHSGQAATLVHEALAPAIAQHYRGLPDLGVKTGPFYVLFLSSMPAILVEAGFLTNRHDARLLRDTGYLAMLADQISDGLDRYREARTRLALGVGQ